MAPQGPLIDPKSTRNGLDDTITAVRTPRKKLQQAPFIGRRGRFTFKVKRFTLKEFLWEFRFLKKFGFLKLFREGTGPATN